MRNLKTSILTAAMALAAVFSHLTADAAEPDSASAVSPSPEVKERATASSYLPQIHGVVRARWEMATESGESRFQVRNARVRLGGDIGTVFRYFIQTDFCDRGVIKILDAWGAATVAPWLTVRVGQFRMPFGMDSFRAPGNYLFGNRSFIGKQMCNFRATGGQLMFTAPKIPVSLNAGIFNPTSISDHEKWVKTYAYSTKLTFSPGPLKLTTGFQSIEPDSVRINLWNIGASWKTGRLTLEAEFMNKHYTHKRHKATKGWLATANYDLPFHKGVFNTLSFQGRYDGMTAHSTGTRDPYGDLVTNHTRRQRATIGSTLTYNGPKSIEAKIRLNYEKYFYPSHTVYEPTDGDKLLMELVLCF